MWVLDADGNGINLDHVAQLKVEPNGRRNSLTTEWSVQALGPARPGVGAAVMGRLIDGVNLGEAETFMRILMEQLSEEWSR